MGIFLNRGNQGFRDIVNSRIYVDKTDMIGFLNASLNSEQRCICVSRPRRFGKSVTARMIAAYYDRSCDSRELFQGRKLGQISGWDSAMNRYDVIKLDLSDIMSSKKSSEEALDYMKKVLYEDLSDAYPELLLDFVEDPADWLCRISLKTGNRFVIIIDEWDAFFRDDKNNPDVQMRYINLLRSLFKRDRSGEFLALAYITGILPIKRYASESALNNFYEFTMLNPSVLSGSIGFTTDEVKDLCRQYDMDYEVALEWYDGYCLGGEQHVCGANSVVKALTMRSFSGYWSHTAAFDSLKTYITLNYDGLKDAVLLLLGGQRIKVKTVGFENDMESLHNKDDVLTLLVHLGYLAYDAGTQEVYIPNREVREYFEATIELSGWNELIEALRDSEELLKWTLAGEEELVAEKIDECHRKNTSVIKYHDENSLACCIALAYYAAQSDYNIYREMPAGYGFADLVFLPKKISDKPAMVIELKWNKKAETALTQIRERKYPESLSGYCGQVLLCGISYEKEGENAKKHHCLIEKISI